MELRDAKPLRSMFLDLNAYFASVEQAAEPSLRGKPVAVCPVMADSSFVIAASYEAKKFGVSTGCRIGDARQKCPEIQLVPARPALYVHYHNLVQTAVDTVLPVAKVCSIDEMAFNLIGTEREPDEATWIAHQLKAAIWDTVSPHMSCSIGIAPNRFLSKLATDLMKPDGLVMIQGHELPDRLRGLSLREFCGINHRMEARLQAAGIFSSDGLLDASKSELARAFGSIVGERWFYLLRGHDVGLEEHDKKGLGHSHVLAPELRNDEGVRQVLLRLTTKAAARLRAESLWAGGIGVFVKGRESWEAKVRVSHTHDSLAITERVLEMWEAHKFTSPLMVGINFWDLRVKEHITPSLFEQDSDEAPLSEAMDRMNQKFGKNSVFLASLSKAKDSADEKIAFNKTWLFKEGKGDHDWVEPAQE